MGFNFEVQKITRFILVFKFFQLLRILNIDSSNSDKISILTILKRTVKVRDTVRPGQF